MDFDGGGFRFLGQLTQEKGNEVKKQWERECREVPMDIFCRVLCFFLLECMGLYRRRREGFWGKKLLHGGEIERIGVRHVREGVRRIGRINEIGRAHV